MSMVNILLQVTEKIHAHVTSGLPEEDGREEYIETLNELIVNRQLVIEQLPDLYTEEELKMGMTILHLNEVIDPLLEKHLNSIRNSLSLLNKKKQKSSQYANPYQAVSGDGMFFDKKK
ncbi:hypothetical protein ACFQPF_15260 [Fictibacillus iocasae]|uniref:Flagellar protein FliT n=1 Tax=Fictibacillus iocasae TaxID=2715437 RepID=A0ABW2NUF6_9BACL